MRDPQGSGNNRKPAPATGGEDANAGRRAVPADSIPAAGPAQQDPQDDTPASEWAVRGLLLLIVAVICAITWRKWGDLSVDCGREMYIPAVLSQGKRLYFDAWYLYGPLIHTGTPRCSGCSAFISAC